MTTPLKTALFRGVWALTTTHENSSFQKSIRPFFETPLAVLIAGCGVLTGCRVRDIRSLSSWRPASTENGYGAKSLKPCQYGLSGQNDV
jgi:hypothetical protein